MLQGDGTCISSLTGINHRVSSVTGYGQNTTREIRMLGTNDSRVALEQVIAIGNELKMSLSDYLSVDQFVGRMMDKIEGRRSHVEKMQFLVAYRQQFLMGAE